MSDTRALFDPCVQPCYWIFVGALLLNAIYPSVLLRSTRKHAQRDAVAACDAALDVVYALVYMLSTFSTLAYSKMLPLERE